MTKYRNIYFDLDNTLWDFETNARDTFREIFDIHHLWNTITDFERFISTFALYNEQSWEKYRLGQIRKEELRIERFCLTLHRLKIPDHNLSGLISDNYLELMPQKSNLVENTLKVLEYLKPRYRLFILTNGFHDIQSAKLENSGIRHYFNGIITSEDTRWSKPDPRTFEYALKSVNAKKAESLMVGDNLILDISGARNFGMDQVFFNRKMISHDMNITYEINELKELMLIL
ncbi:MAG: YjjG family noncanonical pyrimidine nucleotidase [Bacteroidales bacterium]|nr:YjjG family noncanonical pyrimidine nucleotidase [Bacteroidales bacterium]